MITLSGFSGDCVNHFRCLEEDVTNEKHIPNEKGIMECTGVKLLNGDELFCIDSGSGFVYDLENREWLLQIGGTSSSGTTGSAELTHSITSNVKVGNTNSGYTFTRGMTFDEYIKAVHVAYLKPVIKLTPKSTVYEIGDLIGVINVVAEIEKKDNPITSVELYLNDTLLKTDTTLTNGGTLTVENVGVNTTDTDFSITCKANDGKSVTTVKNEFKFARFGFYGCDESEVTMTTSDEIRGLSDVLENPQQGDTFTINIPTGARKITIALPNGFELAEALYHEGMNLDVKDTFVLSKIDVEGKYSYPAVEYNVYTYTPAIAIPSPMTYTCKIK